MKIYDSVLYERDDENATLHDFVSFLDCFEKRAEMNNVKNFKFLSFLD